ncbi:MAG: glycerophosphodiester phosphodiesterase [Proteobacteria bacterium]|nr:glycerophosphodiester phosphodiesterase [Pseudomonadota bacterium]MCP4920287.1 glycerophosphodiester phosphodiesterase [Pseudomonadota bacterium]
MLLLALMAFDLQGHRGARGLRPENTLAGFRHALELGVTTLELDVGLTSDGVLVVSHDPQLGELARDRDGARLAAPVSIHGLSFAELRSYDVGRLDPTTEYAKRWPEQVAVDGERVPALAEVFALSDTARFNVETKLDPTSPHETASPQAFVEALREAVAQAGVAERVTVQSFDWRTLAPLCGELATACLTAEDTTAPGSPWTGGLDPADFATLPELVASFGCGTWSPHHRQLTPQLVASAHELGLLVVPWTVNDVERAAELRGWGVDGLIADYPDRVVE